VSVLLLIRHAVTDTTGKRLSAPGLTLSERGREQAAALAERLRDLRLEAIYSSPLRRCLETAAPLAEAAGLEVRTDEGFRDTEYGEWSGRPLAQVARTKLWRALHQRPSSVRFPGGETLSEVQARTVGAIDAIVAAHPRGLVAVFAHADVVKLALMHVGGMHVDVIDRVAIAPASVSAVALGPGQARVLRVNDTGSLADLTPPRKRRGGSAGGRGRGPAKVGG
jgi:probable phosphomutase (TIGR03848 family)